MSSMLTHFPCCFVVPPTQIALISQVAWMVWAVKITKSLNSDRLCLSILIPPFPSNENPSTVLVLLWSGFLICKVDMIRIWVVPRIRWNSICKNHSRHRGDDQTMAAHRGPRCWHWCLRYELHMTCPSSGASMVLISLRTVCTLEIVRGTSYFSVL